LVLHCPHCVHESQLVTLGVVGQVLSAIGVGLRLFGLF
jgi:hypothetical protein